MLKHYMNDSKNYSQWIEFAKNDLELMWISIHYLQSRYPDNFEDIDLEDAKRSLEIATKFEKFILPKFGSEK